MSNRLEFVYFPKDIALELWITIAQREVKVKAYS
jgi:hypothetical protein